jgi:hypothetical protein
MGGYACAGEQNVGDKRTMKRIVLVMILALVAAPVVFAQGTPDKDHGEVGAFFNWTRLHNANDTNFYGVGGRVGFNVHPNVQIEGEMAYDFAKNFTITTSSFTTSTRNLRMLHGLFGPKFQVGTGAIRAFATVKGGFLNFSTDHNLANQFTGVPNGDTHGVFYPGGGIEAYAGWFGFRAEVGDEMYFDNGANHNLRVTVGPQIRF